MDLKLSQVVVVLDRTGGLKAKHFNQYALTMLWLSSGNWKAVQMFLGFVQSVFLPFRCSYCRSIAASCFDVSAWLPCWDLVNSLMSNFFLNSDIQLILWWWLSPSCVPRFKSHIGQESWLWCGFSLPGVFLPHLTLNILLWCTVYITKYEQKRKK